MAYEYFYATYLLCLVSVRTRIYVLLQVTYLFDVVRMEQKNQTNREANEIRNAIRMMPFIQCSYVSIRLY